MPFIDEDDLKDAMTISQMVKHLNELKQAHGDLPVGRSGHFGEFNRMTTFNVDVKHDTTRGWPHRDALWINIEAPNINIGEEPC